MDQTMQIATMKAAVCLHLRSSNLLIIKRSYSRGSLEKAMCKDLPGA